ncbi:MAG TPA: hypothetical protein VGZ22_10720 [Isosphaeraceae bacterium]|jgi:plastocyanin|nr:hypothetical protein [Isosphaeraceae bacterium]
MWSRIRIAALASAAAPLLLALAGCGGGSKSDEAVTLPSDPLATNTAPASSSGTTAPPATGTPAATNAPAPAAPAGGAEGWGTIKGRVVFDGTPPEAKVLDTKAKDPEVCGKVTVKSERLVVDPESKGVRYAFVYIPKPTATNPEAKSNAESATHEFDQKNCTFVPHALATIKGAKITLKSSDPINHNINAKLRSNATFNSVLTANQVVTYDPTAPERAPVEVVCDIHNWMKAYWLILDSPYYAVTDEKGNFEIKNVPAGSQKLVVWQEATAYVTPSSGEAITVKANDTTAVPDIKIEPAKVRPE